MIIMYIFVVPHLKRNHIHCIPNNNNDSNEGVDDDEDVHDKHDDDIWNTLFYDLAKLVYFCSISLLCLD